MSNLLETLRDAIVVTSEGKGLRLSLSADDVEAAADRIEALERERDEARGIIAACAAALPNGAFIDAERASLKFMAMLPSEIASVCAASQAEVTRLKEALRKMHRRAQSAEGQAGAARYELEMWASHPVMKTVGGYLAREVAKSGLKGLNRRARSVLEEQKP